MYDQSRIVARLLVIDDSGLIEPHLRSLEIDFEICQLFDILKQHQQRDVDLPAHSQRTSQAPSIFLVSAKSWRQIQNHSSIKIWRTGQLVIIIGAGNDTFVEPHQSNYLHCCDLNELNQKTLSQYGVIARQLETIQQLKHESHCYREMVDSCPDYVFVRDSQNRIVFANTALAGLHELKPKDMIGKTYAELTGDIEGGRQAAIQDKSILDTGKPYYQDEDFYQDESGAVQWNRVTKKRISNHDGCDHFILGVATDLTEWKKKETQLQESESRFRALYRRERILGNISDTISSTDDTNLMLQKVAELILALFETDRGGVLESDSTMIPLVKTAEGDIDLITALNSTSRKGKNHSTFSSEDSDSIIAAAIRSNSKEQITLYALKTRGGDAFTDQDSELLGTIANQCDLTLSKIDLHLKIEHQAYHDSLTGLPNRFNFERQLEHMLAESLNGHQQFGVVFLDLDGFKAINDTYGHLVGDKVLVEISRRLSIKVGTKGFLARMGGDEFSLILYNFISRDSVHEFSSILLNEITKVVPIDSHKFSISASIGISIYPFDGKGQSELMRRADSAMYHAKSAKIEKVSFFNKEIELQELRRQRLEADLALALHNGELELHYQPQIDLKTGMLCGFEALTRWQHTELGFIPPTEFIAVAEQSQLIFKLGDWVIDTAIQQTKQWQDQGHVVKTAINLSPRQCELDDFSERFIAKFKSLELDTTMLQVEVTESMLMNDLETVSQHLQALREHGLTVAIDDFGTGYSSLGYLQHLPLDILKIDRSFVGGMNVSNPENSLVGVITRMAHDLGLKIVVEGVEAEDQVNATVKLGCDIAQGWYFAKAMPAEQISSLLTQTDKLWLSVSDKAA